MDVIRRKLECWRRFGPADRQALDALPGAILSLRHGETFAIRNARRADLAFLVAGRAYAYDVLPNGARHISNFYHPGDILNYHALAVGCAAFDYVAVGSATLFMARREAFTEALRRCGALADAVVLAETARTLSLTDRFRAATRLEGTDRVLHLLLELAAVEELTGGAPQDGVDLSFTQEQLADMMGLTPVHVSKMMSRLKREGTIRRARRRLVFQDRAAAERRTGFVNRYARRTESLNGAAR